MPPSCHSRRTRSTLPSRYKRAIALVVLLTIPISGCLTRSLMDAADPTAYALISKSSISEEELRARGLDYRTSPKLEEYYYVEKDDLQKLKDTFVIATLAPLTVVVDVATVITVVGVVVFAHVDWTGQSWTWTP